MMRGTASKAIFSARTNLASYLDDIKEQVAELIEGNQGVGHAQHNLQKMLESYDYTPEAGFSDFMVPPAKAGGITDLSSDARTKLVVETNYSQAVNFGRREEGLDQDALWRYPAWELVRLFDRDVPRGFKLVGGQLVVDLGNDWPSRWRAVGGVLTDGRMIALKTDEIWGHLGDSDVFDDGLNTPYPPFAFSSGMDWMQVERSECVALGLIDEDEEIQPAPSNEFAEELQDSERTRILSDLKAERLWLLQEIEKEKVELTSNEGGGNPYHDAEGKFTTTELAVSDEDYRFK